MAEPTTQVKERAPASPSHPRGLPAFRRGAPFLLFRHPALLAAVALGSLLLAVAAAAYPLFMAATTSNLVRAALDRPSITRYGAGLSYTFADAPLDRVQLFDVPPWVTRDGPDPFQGRLFTPGTDEPTDPFRRLAAGSPILGPPVAAILGNALDVSIGGGEPQDGRLFASTGVLDHVERLAGTEGDGVWIADLIAEQLGVGPGDTIQLQDPEVGTAVPVLVDGIYRAIYKIPPGGYWLPWTDQFRLPDCADCGPLPQPILADRDQLLGLERELGQTTATFRWMAPLAVDSITLDQARALEQYQRGVMEQISFPDGRYGETFLCCQRFFHGAIRPLVPRLGASTTSFASSIGFVVDEAEKRIVTLEGPARVLEVAGIAVALVVVAAAGAFSVRSRHIEAAWQFARGRSPAFVGSRTALETLLPCLVGGTLGFGIAVLAVGTLGPGGPVDRSTFADAGLATLAAVLGAIVLMSIVAARTYLRVVDPHGRRFARLVSVVPWELAIIGLAFVALQRLRETGAFVTDERLDVVRPSLALIAFPFLLLAGFSLLAARLARHAFTWMRRPTTSAPAATYLATRRLAAGGAFTMLLLGGTGLCLGTFLHAQIVSRSLQSSVDAKAHVFVGSDASAQVIANGTVPEDFPYPATRVVQIGEGARLPSRRPLDLLAIDADTFAGAAYWNSGFDDASLEEITRRLGAAGDGPLPVVLAAGGDLSVHEVLVGAATVPVEVVARPSAFPGLYSRHPLLVVDEDRLLERLDLPYNPLARYGAELWARGDPEGLRRAFAAMETPSFVVRTAEEIADIPHVAAAIDTFIVVNALGAIAAALAFVGMLMYLQARQRSQVVSYALSTRMGMRHGQHRRALTIELGVMLALAFVVAAALSFAAARVTVPRLDPITAIPPPPLFVLPIALIFAAAAAIAALVWIGAAVTNRRARRVDLGEVMRVAE